MKLCLFNCHQPHPARSKLGTPAEGLLAPLLQPGLEKGQSAHLHSSRSQKRCLFGLMRRGNDLSGCRKAQGRCCVLWPLRTHHLRCSANGTVCLSAIRCPTVSGHFSAPRNQSFPKRDEVPFSPKLIFPSRNPFLMNTFKGEGQ